MLVFIWLAVLVATAYLYLKQVYSRFENTDVKCQDIVPIMGTSGRILMRKEQMANYVMRIYNEYSDERFYGSYEFLRPIIVVKDIELLKQITVKDFDSFMDHRIMVDASADPIFGRNLFGLRGQEWRNMRSALSPAFTSSKIKLMVPLMVEVGNDMIESFKKKIRNSNKDYIEVETKDLTTRYANDVIASCAFGLKVCSTTDENNVFFQMGKQVTNFNIITMLKMFLLLVLPKVMKFFNITFFSGKISKFFKDIILNTMQDREKHNIIRPDMIHLLMEAKKGQLVYEDKTANDADAGFATVEESEIGKESVKKSWSDDDLVAQAVLFLLAGFDTVSTAMSFALHELAVNPDVQERLVAARLVIKENERVNGGKFDYTSIQNMVYMDMVVSEVLRLWPPGVALERLCTRDCNLGKPNKTSTKDYILRKGESVMIPIWGLHHDPKYFSNPNKFDPERFSEENKHNIVPFSYAPFGMGPRNCIGSRFALCEVKVMLYQLLQHFEVNPNEKTCIPVELDKANINLRIEGGHWVTMKLRN